MHDGAGLRTVLFLKGCPLRCQWCSTPESWSYAPEMGYGVEMSASEAVREIAKDEIFYFHSGGGVTISGGEPLEQTEFVQEILRACEARGIDRAMESSFFGPWERIEMLLPHLNRVYVDVKHPDSARHKVLTGVENEPIWDNIRRADASPFGFEMVVRTPLVPGVNDSAEDMERLAGFVKTLRRPMLMEFLAYHRLGTETYRKLGIRYPLPETAVPDAAQVERAARHFRKFADIPVAIGGRLLHE